MGMRNYQAIFLYCLLAIKKDIEVYNPRSPLGSPNPPHGVFYPLQGFQKLMGIQYRSYFDDRIDKPILLFESDRLCPVEGRLPKDPYTTNL
jgi:hypothetical protein